MRQRRSASAALLRGVALALFLPACAAESKGPATIALDVPANGGKAAVVVRGVPASALAALRGEMTRDQWNEVLRVSVGDGQPAMLGDYALTTDGVRFTPMFALDPGRQYVVVFTPAQLTATVGLPASPARPDTVVSHVYPSADVVPENQLRLYVHFSAPMGRKGGLDYIRLVDAGGKAVVDSFLPLDAEFWNDDHTRYTVFFDPGRQKRGIMPNREMGRSLVPGQRYTLIVDREWRDANGLPLKESFQRTFAVGPADERPLDFKSWRIDAPAADTRDALVVRFSEALDHGLLQRALGVAGRNGQPLAGDITIDEGETRWRFVPREPWRPGGYQLVALGLLEDLAGNRIGRAFEVDRFERADRSSEPERTTLPFTISKH